MSIPPEKIWLVEQAKEGEFLIFQDENDMLEFIDNECIAHEYVKTTKILNSHLRR